MSRLLTVFRHLFSIVSQKCLKCESTFNQEKALVGVLSMIVKTDGSFTALMTLIVAAG